MTFYFSITRDETMRALYRSLLKDYEVAMKAAKHSYFSAYIASATLCPPQLFRVQINNNNKIKGKIKIINKIGSTCSVTVLVNTDCGRTEKLFRVIRQLTPLSVAPKAH